MSEIEYNYNGRKYRKLNRNEIIKDGCVYSFCGFELRPIFNRKGTIGYTPESFDSEEEFYEPIIDESFTWSN